MTRRTRPLCLVAGLLAACFLARPATAADNPAILAADRALLAAVARVDVAAVGRMLDADATWTDAMGRTLGPGELARALPALGIPDESGASVRRFDYGRVGVVQVGKGRLHTLRVWVQRPAGWRLLVSQDVRLLDAPPTSAPGIAGVCDNPCKRVPYQPKTDNERAVIAAYQSLETTAVASDANNWGKYVADEFLLVSSNGDRALDKPTRIEGLRRATHGGVMPTQLVSAMLFDFGTAVVMRAEHKPDRGDNLQIGRVWVKRNGGWMSTLSYQTSIRATR